MKDLSLIKHTKKANKRTTHEEKGELRDISHCIMLNIDNQARTDRLE